MENLFPKNGISEKSSHNKDEEELTMKTQKWSRTLVAAVLAAAAVVHTLPASAGGTLPVTDAAVSVVRASSASVSIIDAAGVNEAAYAACRRHTNRLYADPPVTRPFPCGCCGTESRQPHLEDCSRDQRQRGYF